MVAIIWGFIFGAFLQYARLNRFDTIAGMAVLQNFTVAKMISFTIGLGALLLQAEVYFGWAEYHVKPLILFGVVVGGLLFGVGMAILGYCPGTVVISLGQGNLDALFGIVGGVCGALIFAVLYPHMAPMLGPDLGALSVRSLLPDNVSFWTVSVALAIVFMGIALFLQHLQPQGWKWLHAAIGLSLLNVVLNLPSAAGHPMGASTAFAYAAMSLTGMGAETYWQKIAKPGAWELWFLVGAFLAGLFFSLFQRTFRITSVPDLWTRYYGSHPARRFVWAFIGGFLLLFGARMAGGCTSGHVISGGMQLAISSLLFAIVVFAAFLTTGRYFYRARSGIPVLSSPRVIRTNEMKAG
ncbi:MAG: YeeE/YedE family protein [Gallionella sp.]|jgi:hypothetical protein|nr:YeeE/YedE family protein [Gallionella sp.]